VPMPSVWPISCNATPRYGLWRYVSHSPGRQPSSAMPIQVHLVACGSIERRVTTTRELGTTAVERPAASRAARVGAPSVRPRTRAKTGARTRTRTRQP
jgi:hypothetical protein